MQVQPTYKNNINRDANKAVDLMLSHPDWDMELAIAASCGWMFSSWTNAVRSRTLEILIETKCKEQDTDCVEKLEELA